MPYPSACTTFAYTVAGEHAFTRPTTLTDRMPRFTFLTPYSRKFLRSIFPPAVWIATYETDSPDERTASAHQHFGQRSGH
ncbi:MAG: hypothetical protein SPE09_01990 [Alloprevotella sp.]|nr:hypothetical protein [Alloprevotella sp.]